MTLRQIKKNIRQSIKDLEANNQGHDWTHLGRLGAICLLKDAIKHLNDGIKRDKEKYN